MKVLKALVTNGRFKGVTVKVTNISMDEMGRQKAACVLSNQERANIFVTDLSFTKDEPEPEPKVKGAKTASMPFISGSSSSRSLTHTKNMAKPRLENKPPLPSKKQVIAKCENCGQEYNMEDRKGQAGKITQCENCAEETETKV